MQSALLQKTNDKLSFCIPFGPPTVVAIYRFPFTQTSTTSTSTSSYVSDCTVSIAEMVSLGLSSGAVPANLNRFAGAHAPVMIPGGKALLSLPGVSIREVPHRGYRPASVTETTTREWRQHLRHSVIECRNSPPESLCKSQPKCF